MLRLKINKKSESDVTEYEIVFFKVASTKMWEIIKGALKADNVFYLGVSKIEGELIE